MVGLSSSLLSVKSGICPQLCGESGKIQQRGEIEYMENSHRFFENKECRYFPCHKNLEEFNCLFCYCPLYTREHCPENYEAVINLLKNV